MEKMKKIVFAFICLFGIGMMNVNAENYGIVIANEELSSEKTSIGKITYDAKTNTMVLDNVTLNDSAVVVGNGIDAVIDIKTDKDIIIILKGKNVITTEKNVSGIFSNSNLTIKGDGSLKISTKSAYPIVLSNAKLTVEGTSLNLKSESGHECILVDSNDINIKDSIVYTVGGFQGIEAKNIVIDNSIVDLEGTSGSVQIGESLTIKNLKNMKIYDYGMYGQESDKEETKDITTSDCYEYFKYGYGYFKILPNETKVSVEIPEIDTSAKTDKMVIGVSKNNNFDNAFKKVIENSDIKVGDFDTIVEISVENIDEKSISENIIKSINTFVEKDKGLKVSSFFDISLNVKDSVTEESLGILDESDSEITFNVLLPTDLTKVEDGYTRTYYIVRYHDGDVALLDTIVDGNIISFKTDKFSTYALAYTDVKNTNNELIMTTTTVENNPKTGDSVILYMTFSLIAIFGVGYFSLKYYKRRQH